MRVCVAVLNRSERGVFELIKGQTHIHIPSRSKFKTEWAFEIRVSLDPAASGGAGVASGQKGISPRSKSTSHVAAADRTSVPLAIRPSGHRLSSKNMHIMTVCCDSSQDRQKFIIRLKRALLTKEEVQRMRDRYLSGRERQFHSRMGLFQRQHTTRRITATIHRADSRRVTHHTHSTSQQRSTTGPVSIGSRGDSEASAFRRQASSSPNVPKKYIAPKSRSITGGRTDSKASSDSSAGPHKHEALFLVDSKGGNSLDCLPPASPNSRDSTGMPFRDPPPYVKGSRPLAAAGANGLGASSGGATFTITNLDANRASPSKSSPAPMHFPESEGAHEGADEGFDEDGATQCVLS